MNNAHTPRATRLKFPLILLAIGLSATYGLPAFADEPATTLTDIVKLAAQNDQTLKAADQNRMAIAENRSIAQSGLLPQISAVAGASYNRTDVQYGGLATAPKTIKGPSSNLGINLNQVIYNRIDNLNLGIADLQAQQAELDYAAAQQNLILRAAQAYFAVLKANAGLQLAIASQNAFKNQLEQAQKRYDVGLIAVTDVANAQANYDKANADIISNRNTLENARAALATLTGQQPNDLSDIQTDLATPRPQPDSLQAWTNLATKQNITLQSAEIGGQIAHENIAINRAAAAPTVSLVGQYGYNTAPSQFNGNQSGNLAGSVGLQIAMPLYTGGRINAKSRQAAFQYQQTQNQIENLRRQTEQGTANDYRGVLTNLSEISAYQQAVESARTSLAATQAGYQVGTRTIVDVLNAQTLVFSAMANFLNARYNYLVSALQLKADTGQLSLSDIEAINAELIPGKVNALIAPLMHNLSETPQAQQKMIDQVIKRAKQTVDSRSE